MTHTDAELVARVLDGDTEAFGGLVDRHHDRCLRIAVHLLGDPADAEDAVQEAMLRAYRHLGGYREQERFGAWLTRIVVNQCRTQRARRRETMSLSLLPVEPAAPGTEGFDERTAQRAELEQALGRLPAEQREAVVLRFTDDLTYDEMAAVTGVGVSALKMRVQRACARLRQLLTEVACV